MRGYQENSGKIIKRSHLYLVGTPEPNNCLECELHQEKSSPTRSSQKFCKEPDTVISDQTSCDLVKQAMPKDDLDKSLDSGCLGDMDEIWYSGVFPIVLLIAISIIHFTIFSLILQSVPTYSDWHP